MHIEWQGIQPPQKWVDKCVSKVAEMDLEHASDLIFHDEWLIGKPGDERHVCACIWGEVGVDHLFGQLHFNPKYISLKDLEGLK